MEATYLHPKSVMSCTARAEMPFLRDLINYAPILYSFDKIKKAIDEQY